MGPSSLVLRKHSASPFVRLDTFHTTATTKTLCLALLVALACAGPSGPRRPNLDRLNLTSWHELRGETFVLYSDTRLEDLEKFALDIARYVAVVDKVATPSSPNAPANFFLLTSESERLFVGQSAYVGVAMSSLSGWDSYVRGSSHDPILRQTLLHEFTHYLTLRNTSAEYPTWYTEGFAEYLSATRAREDVMEVGGIAHGRVEELTRRRAREIPIDLEETFAFEKGNRRPFPENFYATSWAAVHFLNQSLRGQEQLRQMLALQVRGAPWFVAYNEAFDEPPAKLATKIERHIEALSQGAPATRYYLDLDELEVATQWEVRELAPSEVALTLGELALRRADSGAKTKRHLNLAAALLEKSQTLDPSSLRAAAAMAACLARDEDFEESHRRILRIDSSAIRDHQTLNHLGKAYQLIAAGFQGNPPKGVNVEAFHKTARDLFERALEDDARSAVSWAGLGRAQMIENDLAKAKSSFEASQRFGEWDPESTLELGKVEKHLGNTRRARELWQRVSEQGRPRHRKLANELLKTLEGGKPEIDLKDSHPRSNGSK